MFWPSMKRFAVFAAVLLTAACASSGPQANIAAPDLEIEQTFGPGDLGYPDGPLDVKYQLRIVNNATIPITLKRVNLHTVNPPGGAYTLTPPLVHPFEVQIPPKSEKTVEMWAHAQGYGVSARDREPVTVKGTAYFDTAQGIYNQVLNQELQQ
ncbi:MAG TPA: hypothetical protein VI670_06755 [Thermoanaerobaculia bacterium]